MHVQTTTSSSTPAPIRRPPKPFQTFSNTFVPLCAAVMNKPHYKISTCRTMFTSRRFDSLVNLLKDVHQQLNTNVQLFRWTNSNYLHPDDQERLLFVNEITLFDVAKTMHQPDDRVNIMAWLNEQNERNTHDHRVNWNILNFDFLQKMSEYFLWCIQNNSLVWKLDSYQPHKYSQIKRQTIKNIS